MAQYQATVLWQRDGEVFTDNRYNRGHQWEFDGGLHVAASSSPHVVPLPYSVAAAVDPEEAFVASLSSCHMLFFLSLAAKQRLVVERYRDEALGTMGRNDAGKNAMIRVVLRPQVTFAPDSFVDDETLASLHHAAHDACYLANSVHTHVVCEPVPL